MGYSRTFHGWRWIIKRRRSFDSAIQRHGLDLLSLLTRTEPPESVQLCAEAARPLSTQLFLKTTPVLLEEKDDILVATRGSIEFAVRNPQVWPPEQFAKVIQIYQLSLRGYQKAVKAGVRISLVTDLLTSDPSGSWTHGKNCAELKYTVQVGMTPLQTVRAATADGLATLGAQTPKSGCLCEGYDADMMSLGEIPLDDIELLAKAENIIDIWKRGIGIWKWKDAQSIFKHSKPGLE